MFEHQDTKVLTPSTLGWGPGLAIGGPDRAATMAIVQNGLPEIKVRIVAGFRVVDIVNTDVLFEEGAIGQLRTQLHQLVEQGGTRLFLNFGGIRYMSSAVLATLAGLYLRVERVQGHLGLFGLDPVLRDMVRICRLDRIFAIYSDEREALSDGNAAGNWQ